MGDAIAYQGQTAVGSGSQSFIYIHNPKGKASKIGIIAAHIASGTQTGVVEISIGGDSTNPVLIYRGSFTAAAPYVRLDPNYVIQPGQIIKIAFSSITAGDVVRCFIGGH